MYKSKGKFSQNFVAFSEYMNFKTGKNKRLFGRHSIDQIVIKSNKILNQVILVRIKQGFGKRKIPHFIDFEKMNPLFSNYLSNVLRLCHTA
jgi:hypothetical protein